MDNKANRLYVFSEKEKAKLNFAVTEIKKAFIEKGYSVKCKDLKKVEKYKKNNDSIKVFVGTVKNNKDLIYNDIDISHLSDKQSYVIRKDLKGKMFNYWIVGGGESGAMYGGIDFAKMVSLDDISGIKEGKMTPYIKNRGIKLNIPLDARTPSYADAGDAAQNNIKAMWNYDFWKNYLDELARNKYNVLSLWNLHPFPSMIKVEDYPDVALDDIMKADINWDKFNSEYILSGENMVNQEILSNLKTEKIISIDEKICFWQKVMEYAKDRGIQVYIFTWNIFTWGADGKYGINNSPQNKTTIDYFRKSVKKLLSTYPLLAGIGITAGENMGDLSPKQKEKWLFESYGKGVMDFLEEEPERKVRFIHRYWWSDMDSILKTFQPLIKEKNCDFDFSFKYSKAHMYSDSNPIFADEIFDSLPNEQQMWCNVRNDDIFHLRWGDPDYVRDYILNLPEKKKSPGFYMGSDGYVWGEVSDNIRNERSKKMEIEKHWYNYMLWGELSYNPEIEDSYFINIICNRFNINKNVGEALFCAWKDASKIIPLVTKFYWEDWDFQWHVESCSSRDGFHSVDDFIKNSPMEGSGILNISDYCMSKIKNEKIDDITPIAVATTLKKKSNYSQENIKRILSDLEETNELHQTIDDIYALSYLGLYYSYKINGAVNLCFKRITKNKEHNYQKKAVNNLKKALENWEKYSQIMFSNYGDTLLGRAGKVEWNKITEEVKLDISRC